MAARTTRIVNDANTRKKIQATQLIKRLTSHVLGEVDMSSTQVTAALGLLKKTLPDLSAVEVQADVRNVSADDMTDAELTSIAAAGSTRAAKPKSSTSKPNPVH